MSPARLVIRSRSLWHVSSTPILCLALLAVMGPLTQVRYDRSNCTEDMRIKFMTDGILLREARLLWFAISELPSSCIQVQADFLCRKYTAIVIDEALSTSFVSLRCFDI